MKKFVDDLFCIIPENKTNEIVEVFNKFDHNISFTIEVETEGRLPFLDVLVIKDNTTTIK